VRLRAGLLWPLLLAACAPEAPSVDDAAVADSVQPAPAPAQLVFDPGAIERGDTVGELTVVSKDVQRAAIDSVWVGDVLLEGDLVVQGVYQSHPDWPTVQAPCFHVTDPASAARVPRFAPDAWTTTGAKTWFCFSNPDVALDVLGSPEQPHEMVIALSRYQIWRGLSDVNDAGELAELIQLGPASRRTLLDPS
jgi:hypothetical protein